MLVFQNLPAPSIRYDVITVAYPMYDNPFVLVEGRGAAFFCVSCDEPLSLEQIVLFCSDLIDIREKNFNVDSLKVLFKEVCWNIIFNFLKERNIFCKL